jgi:hypothetical protein
VSLDELDVLCRNRGWKLKLEVVDATGHTVRSWEGAAKAFLRVRVLDRDDEVLAGRCQSEPGLERPHDLAVGVLDVLRSRGALA